MTRTINPPNISWSSNGEDFRYDTLSDLIDCEGPPVGKVVHFGDVCDIEPSDLIDADDVIQTMQDRAYDEAGEHAENYAENVSDEAVKELNDFLSAWINKYASPTFFVVKNVHEHIITEEDLKGSA